MDRFSLPTQHVKAGTEYLASLRKLGLDPEGLMWAYDQTVDEFVLVLITAHFDFAGPHEIYRLLTRAYNASATPADITPFIVRLHSPKQAIVPELRKAYGWQVEVKPVHEMAQGVDLKITLTVGDLSFLREWIYVMREQKMAPADRNRRWNRFRDHVEKLAA